MSASAEDYRRLTRHMIGTPAGGLGLAEDARPVMDSLRQHLHDLEQASAGLARGFQGFVGKLPGVAGTLAPHPAPGRGPARSSGCTPSPGASSKTSSG